MNGRNKFGKHLFGINLAQDEKGSASADDEKTATVPSWRLKEEADKRRALEQQLELQRQELQLLQEEKRKQEEEKKKQEEEKAKEEGKYQELLSKKEKEIEHYKMLEKKMKEKDEIIKSIANSKLEEYKSLGEDVYNSIVDLIGSDDPIEVLNKIDKVGKLVKKDIVPEQKKNDKEEKKGGTDHKERQASRKQELLEKGAKGLLTPQEKNELRQIIIAMQGK